MPLTIKDYCKCIADHNRLVHDIDVTINGVNAAEQASLCDIFKDVQRLVAHKNFLVKYSALYRIHGNDTKGYSVSYLRHGLKFVVRGVATIDQAIDAAIDHHNSEGDDNDHIHCPC